MTSVFEHVFAAELPEMVPAELAEDPRTVGAGLALSGGGFRAMLFHVGALRRLYETGALASVDRISSVSGGSITAAQLALNWNELMAAGSDTDVFQELVEDPLREAASTLVDVSRGLRGLLTPRRSIASTVATTYDGWFDGATLQDLPDDVEFVFCATNLGTGSVMRFAKSYMVDYRVGKRDDPDLRLGDVVAASAAFPPVLSPLRIRLKPHQTLDQQFPGRVPELAGTDYARDLELSDGGVYDNLGLQPVDKFVTVLVSDGGGPFRYDDDVATNWLGHMVRCWKVADNQVRSLRRRLLIDDFERGTRHGAFWGISTIHHSYGPTATNVHDSWTEYLRSISTRLAPIDDDRQRLLINFGYCMCDAALQSRLLRAPVQPAPVLPHPTHPLSGPAPEIERTPFWKFWRG